MSKNDTATKEPRSAKSLSSSLQQYLNFAGQYAAFIFFIVLAIVYGFILLRINALSSVDPATNTQSDTSAATTPSIDPNVVKQLESLKESNVNVKALFDQARTNPFQE